MAIRIGLLWSLFATTCFAQPGDYPEFWETQEMGPWTYLVKFSVIKRASGATDTLGLGIIVKVHPPSITIYSPYHWSTSNYKARYSVSDSVLFEMENCTKTAERWVVKEKYIISRYRENLQAPLGFGAIEDWGLSHPPEQ